MATRVTKKIEFDAGHRVPHHASKCQNPHGHRYTVEIEVEGVVQPSDGRADGGMVIDFGVLKELLTVRVHDVYDHGFVVWEEDDDLGEFLRSRGWHVATVPWVPTAENMAGAIFDDLNVELPTSMRLTRVTVWETPTSSATVHA